jgi:hypothetical protein
MLLNINEEDYYNFDLVGISCHEKNYRLAWSLNRGMNWMLSKDVDIERSVKGVPSNHTVFKYDDTLGNVFTLIENRAPDAIYLSDLSQFDYLLMIHHEGEFSLENALQELRKCSFVITAYSFNVQALKNKELLLFELKD